MNEVCVSAQMYGRAGGTEVSTVSCERKCVVPLAGLRLWVWSLAHPQLDGDRYGTTPLQPLEERGCSLLLQHLRGGKERRRERERERERERDRERERQRERHTERERERHTEREIERHTEREIERHTLRHTGRGRAERESRERAQDRKSTRLNSSH